MALRAGMLDDRLARDQERRELKRQQPDPDEDEETMLYDIRKPQAFINEGANGVFELRNQTGINTARNIFDSKAVFHP